MVTSAAKDMYFIKFLRMKEMECLASDVRISITKMKKEVLLNDLIKKLVKTGSMC